MLCVNTYEKTYIDLCQEKVNAQIAAYTKLVAAAKGAAKVVDTFEPMFFGNLVLVLDGCFTHRARALERKDGNAMNEVRLLHASLLENDGKLLADKQIKLKPEASVLGLAVGDTIRIDKASFVRLSDAYFDAIREAFAA